MPEEISLFPFLFYWIAILQLHVFIKNSSTMASNNRAELQQRLSVPIGHSKADRDDGIAFLLVQLAKDIAIIREASNSTVQALIGLKGIDSITGTKARIKELKQLTTVSFPLIEHGVDQILSLTKNKTLTQDAERKLSVQEKRLNRQEEQRKIGMAFMNNTTSKRIAKPNQKKLTTQKLNEMLNRRKLAATSKGSTIITPQKKKRGSSRNANNVSGSIIKLKNKEMHLPPPTFDKVLYTLKELILHLEPYIGQGLKSAVTQLNIEGRCHVSGSTFIRHMKKYSEHRILPKDDYFGDCNGRPACLDTGSICRELNAKAHSNLSHVDDGLKVSKEILTLLGKRAAEDNGLCTEIIDHQPSRRTVAAYDHYSTLLDPSISKVPTDSARAKSLQREIQSRSIRTLFCHSVSTLLTSFTVGKWIDKPKEGLPDGALKAHAAIEKALDMHMKPRPSNYIHNSDDTGRFIYEGETLSNSLASKKRKLGKASKVGTAKSFRSVSSLWRKAEETDTIGQGVKCKFKVLAAASGHVAPIVIHFYGLPAEDLQVPFIEFKVKGLSIGGEVKANCEDIGYVIMSNRNASDSEQDVTLTEQVMKWYHDTIVMPFIRTCKKNGTQTEQAYMMEGEDLDLIHSETAILKMDSEIPYLNYLKRPETIELNTKAKITITKIGGASTETSQALDVGECFRDLTGQMAQLTLKGEASQLKSRFTKMLIECPQFTCKNPARKRAMIDAVAIAPEAYRKAMTRNKVKGSFANSGEISRIGNSKRYITCPNLDEMRKRCKIKWTVEMWDWFCSQLVAGIKEMHMHGMISEEWFDANQFPMDTTVEEVEVPKVFTLKQLHLQRHVIFGHQSMKNYYNDCHATHVRKKRSALQQRYNIAKNLLKRNQEAQTSLKRWVLGLPVNTQIDDQVSFDWNQVEVKHLNKLTVALLQAFVRVRKQVDLVGVEVDLPSTKGSLNKVNDEIVGEGKQSKYLLKWAKECSSDRVIAQDPGDMPEVTIQPVSFPSHLQVIERELIQSPFEVTSDFVAMACANFASLEAKGEDFIDQQKANVHNLNPQVLANVLMARLPRNLSERAGGGYLDHFVWNFVFLNSQLGAAILKLHGCPMNDDAVKWQGPRDTLFSRSFLNNPECLSILDEDIPDQVGAYMYEDQTDLGIIRAGSASAGLRKRHKGHQRASLQKTNNDLWSKFYSAYPGTSADGTLGKFQQLRQITGVRYKPEFKAQVVGMFKWDDKTLKILDDKKLVGDPSLLEKQHRMVCYFFEKLFDLMMGLNHNLSSNAGFETFTGAWNAAQLQ